MAEETGIFHDFVVTIPDDPTIPGAVRPTQWNKSHVLQGGSNGQLLIKDDTQPTGFSWSDVAGAVGGRLTGVQAVSELYSGNSPSNVLGTNTVVLSKPSTLIVVLEATILDSTANETSSNLTVQENGANIALYSLSNRQKTATYIKFFVNKPIGSYTYRGFFTVITNPIVSSVLTITILTFN
jgi:hypothetical protein